MTKLTSHQRFQLKLIWLRKGREGDPEVYIKQVCKAKGIEYVPPRKFNTGLEKVWAKETE